MQAPTQQPNSDPLIKALLVICLVLAGALSVLATGRDLQERFKKRGHLASGETLPPRYSA